MVGKKVSGKFSSVTIIVFVIAFTASTSVSQTQCFSEDDKTRIIKSIPDAMEAELNTALGAQILKMGAARRLIESRLTSSTTGRSKIVKERRDLSALHIKTLCSLYNKHGWLSRELVGADGFEVVLFLIRSSLAIQNQQAFLPILIEASDKGQVPKEIIAGLADSIRIKSGQPQLFGTQVVVKDGIAYLQPLLNPSKVDVWRKKYDLPTLNDFMREIESKYITFVIKRELNEAAPKLVPNKNISTNNDEGLLNLSNSDEDEVLEIDTRLVNLNVRLLDKNLFPLRVVNLSKNDFEVFEDGNKQEISFLSSIETPFDLVLLLDLSGSTIEKREVIWKSVRRFVKATRISDRVAIVTHNPQLEFIADFTDAKKNIYKKVKNYNRISDSNIWDALDQTYEKIVRKNSRSGRRTAIVHMTDGEELESKLAFGTLYERLRDWDTTVFSIHLETNHRENNRLSIKAARTLKIIAEETGGDYLRVNKLRDLQGAYERIANELSQVYSLGYEPKNSSNDRAFRRITVKVKNRANIVVRTRSGYYAK